MDIFKYQVAHTDDFTTLYNNILTSDLMTNILTVCLITFVIVSAVRAIIGIFFPSKIFCLAKICFEFWPRFYQHYIYQTSEKLSSVRPSTSFSQPASLSYFRTFGKLRSTSFYGCFWLLNLFKQPSRFWKVTFFSPKR